MKQINSDLYTQKVLFWIDHLGDADGALQTVSCVKQQPDYLGEGWISK